MSATGRRHVSPTQYRAEREQRQRRVLRATMGQGEQDAQGFTEWRLPAPRIWCTYCGSAIEPDDGDARSSARFDGVAEHECSDCRVRNDLDEAAHEPDFVGWQQMEGE